MDESSPDPAHPAPSLAGEDPYDRAYGWGWSRPELRDLVWLCYKTPDLAENARRYAASEEFSEATRVLAELGQPPDHGARVLDFGCGNGIASYALARRGYAVVGVDSSAGALAGIGAARQIVALDGADFELIHSPDGLPELAPASFDVIWVREALHHVRDMAGLLSRFRDLLRPAGLVCCLREVVIWNESQRRDFFATHPFNHITRDEGCYYLREYQDAFETAGLERVLTLEPESSAINAYPQEARPGVRFDAAAAAARTRGYDLFSFFARRP
jgi:SAM-dependent methyltransferase